MNLENNACQNLKKNLSIFISSTNESNFQTCKHNSRCSYFEKIHSNCTFLLMGAVDMIKIGLILYIF